VCGCVAAAVLEQLDVLIKAGKEAVLLHDEKPGLKATLDFAASQLVSAPT
jgi:hypothetical protein